MNVSPEAIRTAKQHTVYAVTVRWAEGAQHSLRYIKAHPYETIVGPHFTSKQALRKFATKHGIEIAYWN